MARASRSTLPIGPMNCPLGDEHCAQLTAALASCAELCQYLDRLAGIGLDVTEWRSLCEGNAALAAGLKQIHFPDRP